MLFRSKLANLLGSLGLGRKYSSVYVRVSFCYFLRSPSKQDSSSSLTSREKTGKKFVCVRALPSPVFTSTRLHDAAVTHQSFERVYRKATKRKSGSQLLSDVIAVSLSTWRTSHSPSRHPGTDHRLFKKKKRALYNKTNYLLNVFNVRKTMIN